MASSHFRRYWEGRTSLQTMTSRWTVAAVNVSACIPLEEFPVCAATLCGTPRRSFGFVDNLVCLTFLVQLTNTDIASNGNRFIASFVAKCLLGRSTAQEMRQANVLLICLCLGSKCTTTWARVSSGLYPINSGRP